MTSCPSCSRKRADIKQVEYDRRGTVPVADLCLKLDPGGHVAFTERLVAAALARQGRPPDQNASDRV